MTTRIEEQSTFVPFASSWIVLLLSLLTGCKSDAVESAETPETFAAPRGQVPILQFAAVADIDERGDVQEYAFADDTVRLRTPRTFAIQDARLFQDAGGYPAVLFVIADEAKEDFRLWTGILVRRQMAMLVDGRVVAVPKVKTALPGMGIVVDETRHWTVEEATALAERIRNQSRAPRR